MRLPRAHFNQLVGIFGAVTKLRMDSLRAICSGFRSGEKKGAKEKRKTVPAYRLGILEGVSASPFFFDLAELSNPHAHIVRRLFCNPYAELSRPYANFAVARAA